MFIVPIQMKKAACKPITRFYRPLVDTVTQIKPRLVTNIGFCFGKLYTERCFLTFCAWPCSPTSKKTPFPTTTKP